jgi:hypothetical protein
MSIETTICTRIVSRALAAGYAVSVYDGEEYPVKRSTNKAAIVAAMFSTDADTLVIRAADGSKIGSVYLVYGNGEDVVCDHTDSPAIAALVD